MHLYILLINIITFDVGELVGLEFATRYENTLATIGVYLFQILCNLLFFFLGGKIPGVRYLQSFLLFLCLFAAYLLRVSISVAIVAMTPDKNSTDFLLETHYHIPVSKTFVTISHYQSIFNILYII